MKNSEILHFESEINGLLVELDGLNLSNESHQELKQRIAAAQEQFKALLSGQSSSSDLQHALDQIDRILTEAAIQQAESEISKAEHGLAVFQAIENVRHEFNEGKLSAVQARRLIKQISQCPL